MAKNIPLNSFTDADPSFPYQSSEAKSQLGIPNSPAIHLAVSQLAELLLSLPVTTNESKESMRISALRCASYGVLMRHSYEHVELRFKEYLDLPIDETEMNKAKEAPSFNWLGQAITSLEKEGFYVPSGVQQQATAYGWNEIL